MEGFYEHQQIYTEITSGSSGLGKAAYEFGNQEVEQEHLLYNLLHQEDSLILKLIEKTGNPEDTSEHVRRH